MTKAIFFDVDGTLVSFKTHTMSPATLQALHTLREKGILLFLSTGRHQAMLDYDAYFEAVGGKVNDSFYYYREQASLQARQYQRALDDLQKAIELNPQELLYRAELAVVNIRVGRSKEAVEVLQEALKIDPSYSEAYRLMGLAYVYQKKADEACAAFAKAKELGNENVDELIEKNCNNTSN